MRQVATIITLTLALNCFGQYQFDKTKISRQIQQVAGKIEKVNELMSSAVYYAGIRPPQFDNFTELQKTATRSELTELTNHSNGVVRCYAFWALSYDTSISLFPIVIKHINDNESIKTQFGCIGSRVKVGDFFIKIVTPQHVDLLSKKLTSSEHEYLDSILVYTPNSLNSKEDAIIRAKLNDSLYLRVRELVLKENNQSALVTLAKFKREQDISLILNNKLTNERYNQLFYTYRAISKFPDKAFLPLLKKSLYEAIEQSGWTNEWNELYKAIASYKNDTALQLLKLPFTQTKYENIRRYHIDFIFEAIQKFYTPTYDELIWEMWENEKKISPHLFNLLYLKNPNRAFLLTKKTIQNANDFYYLNNEEYNEDGELSDNLLDVMIDTIVAHDKPLAIELINKNLKDLNVQDFPIFADKVLKIRDSSFVTSLFERLSTEENPHIYLKATEILIAFKDKDINKRIADIAKLNPNLSKDWGGKAFSNLLLENGIN